MCACVRAFGGGMGGFVLFLSRQQSLEVTEHGMQRIHSSLNMLLSEYSCCEVGAHSAGWGDMKDDSRETKMQTRNSC